MALRNARINIVKGKLRLEIDTWGKITVEENTRIESVNDQNNISEIQRKERLK